MNRYWLVEKKNHLAVHAIFDTAERAQVFLKRTVPDYIRRGYLTDKSLTPDDFEIIQKPLQRQNCRGQGEGMAATGKLAKSR